VLSGAKEKKKDKRQELQSSLKHIINQKKQTTIMNTLILETMEMIVLPPPSHA